MPASLDAPRKCRPQSRRPPATVYTVALTFCACCQLTGWIDTLSARRLAMALGTVTHYQTRSWSHYSQQPGPPSLQSYLFFLQIYSQVLRLSALPVSEAYSARDSIEMNTLCCAPLTLINLPHWPNFLNFTLVPLSWSFVWSEMLNDYILNAVLALTVT